MSELADALASGREREEKLFAGRAHWTARDWLHRGELIRDLVALSTSPVEVLRLWGQLMAVYEEGHRRFEEGL